MKTKKTDATGAGVAKKVKQSPVWTRTTRGIVQRWAVHDRVSRPTLTALRLPGRLLRLFGLGCCRSPRIWPLLPEPVRQALEVAERYADGEVTAKTLRAAQSRVRSRLGGQPSVREHLLQPALDM